jgi:hypothetical protein
MNINEIKAEYREELKGAMVKLVAMQQAGQMDVAGLVAAQGRLFDHYKALSAPKASKKAAKATSKASKTYRVRDLTSFVPAFLGDLYPSREAAESFRDSLTFTKQLTSEVVAA